MDCTRCRRKEIAMAHVKIDGKDTYVDDDKAAALISSGAATVSDSATFYNKYGKNQALNKGEQL